MLEAVQQGGLKYLLCGADLVVLGCLFLFFAGSIGPAFFSRVS